MTKEHWRRVVLEDEESVYLVSDEGNVKNSKTGKILTPVVAKGGYLRMCLYHKGKHYHKTVHQLVARAFVPNPDGLPQVDHLDGHKYNNRADNLDWCTARENVRRAHEMGLCHPVKGEDHPSAIHTEEDIRKVCELLETGKYSYDEICEMTGATWPAVKHTLQGTRWSHISKDYDFSKTVNSPRHVKKMDHSVIHNSIDRAIIAGLDRREIVDTIMEQGLDYERARALYTYRKKKVKKGESIVQCTVYIDEGIEIF